MTLSIAFLLATAFAQDPLPQPLSKLTARDTISLEYYKRLAGPLFESAKKLYDEKKYREAGDAFLKLHESTRDPAALFLTGNCHYNLDEIDVAIRYYRRAIDEGLDKMPDAHYNLANAYYSKYRREDAIREFRRVLELTNDRDPMAHYNLGIILAGEGQHDLSIEHYKKTVELTGDAEPLAHQHLGVGYFMKGEYTRAVHELEVYLQQVPDDPGGHVNLGIALRYQGNLDRAIKELLTAIERSGDQIPSAHYQLARIYAQREEYPLSIKHFEIALARGLRSPKIEAEYDAVKKKPQRR